jgi:hypothetical protein
MTRRRALATLAGLVALASCDKNAVQEIGGPVETSQIRFFNFGISAPAVNFYANATKMTAIGSTSGNESTNGVGYGSVGAGGYYSAIAPGDYTISGKIAAATDKDLAISNFPLTLVTGKRYSFFLSGPYNGTTKTVDGFAVEDDYPETIDWSVAYVRFVNAISNANPMTLYAKNTTTGTEVAVGGAVPYKGAGAFTALPEASYDLAARFAGASTNAISRSAVFFARGKVYTIGARGDITVTSSTATNRPFLDNTPNR